jgi:hypothetical protein
MSGQGAQRPADRARLSAVRQRARDTVLGRYALATCLQRQVELVTSLV